MKPVFVINGFLESGKTEFITYTLSQPYFQTRETTLLIVCEEGEIEYDPELLRQSRTVMEVIEEESDFTAAKLIELEKKYKPGRIVIEWNGMWNYKNAKLPWHWSLEQQITIIDASTFTMYYSNMKSLLAEMLRKSELIIFNRCDGISDLGNFKRNVKAVNQKAEIVFEGSDGEINEILEEDLPYDVSKSVIELDDQGFGIFFIDSMDHLERYVGKELRFVAQVMHPEKLQKGYFIPGRMAMTCCADDMTFLGYPCEYAQEASLSNKEWIKVSAVVEKKYWADYGQEGPVLKAISVEKAKEPKNPVISFG